MVILFTFPPSLVDKMASDPAAFLGFTLALMCMVVGLSFMIESDVKQHKERQQKRKIDNLRGKDGK